MPSSALEPPQESLPWRCAATALAPRGRRSVDLFHRELGRVMWDGCGMSRTASGLRAARDRVTALRAEFWEDVYVGGTGTDFNQCSNGQMTRFFRWRKRMTTSGFSCSISRR